MQSIDVQLSQTLPAPLHAFVRLVLVILFLAGGSATHSMPVTWGFDGQVYLVDSSAGSNAMGIKVGDAFSGSLTFDPGTPLTVTTLVVPNSPGLHPPSIGGTTTSAGADQTGGTPLLELLFNYHTAGGVKTFNSPTGPTTIYTLRNRENEFIPFTEAPNSAFDTFTALASDAIEVLSFRLLSKTSPSGLFPLDELLALPPSLDVLHTGRMGLTVSEPNNEGFQVFAALTSLYKVPIPSGLALFGLGLAGLGWSRRART